MVCACLARFKAQIQRVDKREPDMSRRVQRHLRLGRMRAVAAIAGSAMASWAVGGDLTFDLQFSDGSHTRVPTAGQTYTLDLWAVVRGNNGSLIDESFSNATVVVTS